MAEKTKSYTKIKSPDFYAISVWDNSIPDAVAVVAKKTDLIAEKAFLEAHLAEIPLTDAEKIAWCEANHPPHPLQTQRIHLQERLLLVKEYLSNM